MPNTLPTRSGKPVLLVVDDDPTIRNMLSFLFKKDAQVIVASNGKEAKDIIEKLHPDLVLLDDAMPEMSGMALLEILQKDKVHNTQVIMLTGSNRAEDVKRAIKAGTLDYIIKPFDPEKLMAKVRGRLGKFVR